EVEAGEEFVLFDDVVGDHGLLRARTEVERLQLLKAPHQERKLRLKRRAPFALVKGAKERIRFGLHHALRIQALGQDAGQRALAHSDGTLYRNVTGQFEKISHGLAM